MQDVKVVQLGLGLVISNWGTYKGKPAVFLEPAETPGNVGDLAPVSPTDSVLPGSVILQFHGDSGAKVLLEDIFEALSKGPFITDKSPIYKRADYVV